MRKGLLALGLTLVPLVGAAPAAAATATTVTATGSDAVKVVPKNRKSNASIVAAVSAAQQAGVGGAVTDAHKYAVEYAAAVGFTLGDPIAISDVQSNNGYYVGPFGSGNFQGPFGINRYCGVQVRYQVKRVSGTKRFKVVHRRKVHVCIVPPYETTTLTVTYAASSG